MTAVTFCRFSSIIINMESRLDCLLHQAPGGSMAGKNVESSSTDEPVVFGMTRNEIAEAADALSRQKDQNHRTKAGSYQDMVKNVRIGREALSKQDGYCKGNS
jgi:hypothetical protein